MSPATDLNHRSLRPVTLAGVALSESQARELTERIRVTVEDVWSLLLEAHNGRAWEALGYPNWREYAQQEFDFSRSQPYRLLD